MPEFDPDELDQNPALAVRANLASELSDPKVGHDLYQLTHNEVGGQGQSAQQAFVESVFNRAAARDQPLSMAINDRHYYPHQSYKPLHSSSYKPEKIDVFSRLVNKVINGSNLSRGATGNASGNVGFGGGPMTASFGGEKFGVEAKDVGNGVVLPLPGTSTPENFGTFDPNELGPAEAQPQAAKPEPAPAPFVSVPYKEGAEIRRGVPLPQSQQPGGKSPVDAMSQDVNTLQAPEGSPQAQDIGSAVFGDLAKPPGRFVPNYVGQLATAIDQAMPKQPRQTEDRGVVDAYRQGGIMGVVSNVAEAAPLLTEDQALPVIQNAVRIVAPSLATELDNLCKTHPEQVNGIELGASKVLSGFTSPSTLATIPAFGVPGVAEAWGINELSKTPETWSGIKSIIDKKGVTSSEALSAITQEVARLGMASTAATGRSVASMRTDRAAVRSSVPDAVQAGLRDMVAQAKPPIQKIVDPARTIDVPAEVAKQPIVEGPTETPEQAAYNAGVSTFNPDEPISPPEVAQLPESAFAPAGLTADAGMISPKMVTDMLWKKGQQLNTLRKSFVSMFKMQPQRDLIAAQYDRIDNHASIIDAHFKNETRSIVGDNPMDAQAMIPVLQSGGDIAELVRQNNLVQKSDKAAPDLKRAYAYAVSNASRLNTLVPQLRSLYDRMYDSESAHGIDYKRAENYVTQKYDQDVMNADAPIILDATGGKGATSFFRNQRQFPNYAEAIAQGYVPKTFDIAKLTGYRAGIGQRLINQRLWVDSMKTELDPLTKQPIAVKLDQGKAPPGYVTRELFPGVRVGVSEFFDPMVSALTGESHFPSLPLKAEAAIKHGMLAFDTFHASRLMQMQLALKGKVGWRNGLSLLEYPDHLLDSALENNEITPEMAQYARDNREKFNGLVDHGLNVGKISDALYKDVTSAVPVVGQYQRWLFDKLNRGIITESGLYMLDRNAKLHPEWSQRELYRNSAKEANTYYRNLRSQGIFKRKTWQDAARFFLLAPQWWEGGIRSELKGYGQMLRAPLDLATKRSLMVGNVAKGMGTGILAYGAASQLLNMVTRGHPTWENPEPGQRWSAWIPDLIGGGNGFFLNPLSVFSESMHDLMKYSESKGSAIKAGLQIAQNKLSPMSNAIRDVVFGQDYFGQPLDGLWGRVKQTAWDVSPAPLIAKSYQEGLPAERAALGQVGVKVDIAPTANSQVRAMSNQYMSSKHLSQSDTSTPSPYRKLDRSLNAGDMDAAKSEYRKLKSKGYTDKRIKDRYDRMLTKPFTGKISTESAFKRSMSPSQREIYNKARLDQKTLHQRFNQLKRIP